LESVQKLLSILTSLKLKTRTVIQNQNPTHDKIEKLAEELSSGYIRNLLYVTGDNAQTIVDYDTAMKAEASSYSPNYRRSIIAAICRLSKFHKNKPFKDMTRNDMIAFLDSLEESDEADPLHKWIGTYNLYNGYLFKFFKWYLSSNIKKEHRPKPAIMDNIAKKRRKEISIYKPSDLWSPEDDLLFLKYCPSKREKCYHMVARDTSARPHEIMKLKIRDVKFKTVGTSQYAEATVNGKTGTRAIPLINSIPYLKDYLDHEHPCPGNTNAPLISGTGKKLGRHIDPTRMYQVYIELQTKIFPKMLESPEVVPEDKPLIRELLKKPWNPYIRRHSALTEKSTILREHVLRQHAGWSISSKMPQKYLHYYGNESNESLLEAYGLVDHGIQIDQLRPKQCPNCNEPNKHNSKFCAKCRMVMSYDAWNVVQEEQKKKESEVQSLKEKYELGMKSMREEMENKFNQILAKIDVEKLSIK
jgi:integrase/recombinase XerD